MRLTVGPLPPAVYWRRRAIVLGAALMVLFVVAQACMSGSPADDRADGGPTPSPSPSEPPSPDSGQQAQEVDVSPPSPATGQSAGPDDPPAGADDLPAGKSCGDDEIKLTALATETTFAVGVSVQFTMRIEHDADRSCQRDVGGDQRELYLVPDAGSGRVWSSRDCADPSGEEVLRLTPGWSREHHIMFLDNGGPTCTEVLDPGEYELFARLGSARSEPLRITLR